MVILLGKFCIVPIVPCFHLAVKQSTAKDLPAAADGFVGGGRLAKYYFTCFRDFTRLWYITANTVIWHRNVTIQDTG